MKVPADISPPVVVPPGYRVLVSDLLPPIDGVPVIVSDAPISGRQVSLITGLVAPTPAELAAQLQGGYRPPKTPEEKRQSRCKLAYYLIDRIRTALQGDADFDPSFADSVEQQVDTQHDVSRRQLQALQRIADQWRVFPDQFDN